MIPEKIRAQLLRMPLRVWNSYAIVFDHHEEQTHLMPRGALASWCRAHDLPTLAKEATARRVPKGAILALFLADDGLEFRVLGC